MSIEKEKKYARIPCLSIGCFSQKVFTFLQMTKNGKKPHTVLPRFKIGFIQKVQNQEASLRITSTAVVSIFS